MNTTKWCNGFYIEFKQRQTGVHGTLEMIPLAWKFNSNQLLSKTLNSRMNIIETRAVLKTENFQVETNSCFFKSDAFVKKKSRR